MSILILPLLVAFLGAVALTPYVRTFAERYGFLDIPDGACRAHARPTPLGGGVAVLSATLLGVAAMVLVGRTFDGAADQSAFSLVPLLAASFVLLAVGLLDDRFPLRGRQKLAGQIIAVAIVIAAGLRIERLDILGWTVVLGWWAIPFTLFWLLGAVNALNLLDGADGFATCIGIVITATLVVIAVTVGNGQEAVVACALTGALLGFLVFNFPPSSIFLGDAGSMLIGLIVGVLAIRGDMKGPATVVLATPLALMAIPILDSSAAILRRWLSGKKLSTADRYHLQHTLSRHGFGPRGVLVCVSLLCGITAIGALGSVLMKNQLCAVASVVAMLGIVWANDLFGTTELALLGSRMRGWFGSLLPNVSGKRRDAVHQTRIGRRDSRACRRIWSVLRKFAQHHKLSKVRLDLDEAFAGRDAVLWERRQDRQTMDNWQTRIPVAARGVDIGQIELTGSVDGQQAHSMMSSLGALLDALEPHLEQLVDDQDRATAEPPTEPPTERPVGSNGAVLTFDRADIAGIKFDFLPQAGVITATEYWRGRGQRSSITLTNPHSVMLCHRDKAMHDATLRAGLTLPDGVGVLLAAKLLGYGRRHRVSGPSLMLELCDAGRRYGYRHFFYGGAEGIADQLAERMTEEFPGLQVAGTYCPPFHQLTAEEEEQAVEAINATRPDIIWVGLGEPKQECWMADHAMCINATAMIGVGAAFDFHTGNVKWAPWIVRKCGMEWAYRLALEPRRMWRRNLDSPLFMACVSWQLLMRLARRIFGRLAAPRVHSISWRCAEHSEPELDAKVDVQGPITGEAPTLIPSSPDHDSAWMIGN